jgi:hypothetical protein
MSTACCAVLSGGATASDTLRRVAHTRALTVSRVCVYDVRQNRSTWRAQACAGGQEGVSLCWVGWSYGSELVAYLAGDTEEAYRVDGRVQLRSQRVCVVWGRVHVCE